MLSFFPRQLPHAVQSSRQANIVVPGVIAAACISLVTGAALHPVSAETYNNGGSAAVGTNGDSASGTFVTVTDSGTADSGCFDFGLGCARGVAVSGTGHSQGEVAVSGTGQAGRDDPWLGKPLAAVSGTGGAEAYTVAVSGAGDADQRNYAGYCSPVVGSGATNGVGISGTGNSEGCLAVSGTGYAWGGAIGVSALGDGSGSTLGVSRENVDVNTGAPMPGSLELALVATIIDVQPPMRGPSSPDSSPDEGSCHKCIAKSRMVWSDTARDESVVIDYVKNEDDDYSIDSERIQAWLYRGDRRNQCRTYDGTLVWSSDSGIDYAAADAYSGAYGGSNNKWELRTMNDWWNDGVHWGVHGGIDLCKKF